MRLLPSTDRGRAACKASGRYRLAMDCGMDSHKDSMLEARMEPAAGDPVWEAMVRLSRRGRAPWQLRLAEYLVRGGRVSKLEVHPRYRSTAERIAEKLPALAAGVAVTWRSVSHQAVRMALSAQLEEFTGAPHLLALGPDAATVGALLGGDVFVAPDWRGHGLGAELLLARASLHDGGRMEGTLYSPEGHASAVASHRLAVAMAIAHGLDVSNAVLSDHQGRLPTPGVNDSSVSGGLAP